MPFVPEDPAKHAAELARALAMHPLRAPLLTRYPERVHEHLALPGSEEHCVRMLERCVNSKTWFINQNGVRKKGEVFEDVFRAMFPDPPRVLRNLTGAPVPKWPVIVKEICHKVTEDGGNFRSVIDALTADVFRVISVGPVEIGLTEREWLLVEDHRACKFINIEFWNWDGLESKTLHATYQTVKELDMYKWRPRAPTDPTSARGRLDVLLKRIEHRCIASHILCEGVTGCPLGIDLDGAKANDPTFKEFLTKEEAWALVIRDQFNSQKITSCHKVNKASNVQKRQKVQKTKTLTRKTETLLEMSLAKENEGTVAAVIAVMDEGHAANENAKGKDIETTDIFMVQDHNIKEDT